MGLRDENHTHIDHTFNQSQRDCAVATIFSSLAFLSSSVSMAKLSCLVAASFSSLAPLSSSVSMANLSCLLATIFSSLSFLSNSFSSPRFNLLRVVRRCFAWSSVSDDLFLIVSWLSFFLYPQPFFPLSFILWSSLCFKLLISKWMFSFFCPC